MEHCCHVWGGAPNCYLDMLDTLQEWVSRTVGPTPDASLELLGHRRNVASLSLFYIGITLENLYLNWLNWFHFLIFLVGPLVILIDCMIFLSPFLDFSVTIPRCYRDVNSFFPPMARLLNSLTIKCFPFTSDLNEF